MKNKLKILISTVLLTVSFATYAGSWDVPHSQWNSTNTLTLNRLPAHPTCAAGGLFYFNTTTNLATWPCVEGLEFISGVLKVVRPNWNATSLSPGYIENRPTFATVAITGEYGDLVNLPIIGTIGSDLMAVTSVLSAHTVLGAGTVGAVVYQSNNAASVRTAIDSPSVSDLNGYVPTTRTVNGQTLSSNVTLVFTKTDVGLGNVVDVDTTNASNIAAGAVNNTEFGYLDGVTSAIQAQINGKFTSPSGTTSQYVRGDGSLATLDAYPSSSNPAGYLTTVSSGQVTAALGFTPYNTTNPSAYVNQSGARSAISLTTTGTSGAATYNSTTGVLNIPQYPANPGTVTSVGITSSNLTVTGSPVTTSGSIAVSLPNTGTAGNYTNVTTDAQGRVTSGATMSINNAPSRSLVTSTNATGFQVSTTRIADVCYEGTFQTTSTIGGPSDITVFLETADTNSTTPGDWTTIARQRNSNTITLAVVLQQVDIEPWSICRKIAVGKYVRIRSGSVSGTASATINTEQQESLF
jgi:hypothetical protein